MAVCKYCNGEIVWVKEGRRNKPVNNDGTAHRCEEMKNSFKSIKQIDRGGLSSEEIAKYEKAINTKKK